MIDISSSMLGILGSDGGSKQSKVMAKATRKKEWLAQVQEKENRFRRQEQASNERDVKFIQCAQA